MKTPAATPPALIIRDAAGAEFTRSAETLFGGRAALERAGPALRRARRVHSKQRKTPGNARSARCRRAVQPASAALAARTG